MVHFVTTMFGPFNYTIVYTYYKEISFSFSLSLTSYRISMYVHRITVALDQSHWHRHTHIHTHVYKNTLSRTILDEGSSCHRDLHLTAHNIHNRHINAPVGFEHAIPASELPQTDALEHVATGIGNGIYTLNFYFRLHWKLWSTIKRNTQFLVMLRSLVELDCELIQRHKYKFTWQRRKI